MPVCPNCEQDNPNVARFCLACGTRLSEPPELLAEERKVVTVLFCDLVGFTALSDRADPEDVRARLLPYYARLRQEIERFGGTVEKFIGDAVMAVFGAPVVHEDDPERAVRAGVRILEAIADLNRGHPGLDLTVRIGINTGEAVVALSSEPGARTGMVTGDVVNTAARLEGIAPPGGVLVGESTHRATRHAIEFEELPPVRVKGKAEPLRVWRALRPRGSVGVDARVATPTPFVGREDELEILKRLFGRCLKERSVQLVTVMGEPGVGKSRLIREFFGHVDGLPDLIYWRQGRCLPYGEGITFWPLGEIVKAVAGILDSDGPQEAEEKLGATVNALIEDSTHRERLQSRLAPLVGLASSDLPGGTERADSFSAWRRFLEGMATLHPLVLVFEDLQWADGAMLEFLEHLVEWCTGVPMLLLCTARPDLHQRYPAWSGGKRNSTTITLAPLRDDEINRIIAALLPASALPPEVGPLLLERAGGNPLYAEEFVRMLIELGAGPGAPVSIEPSDIPFPQSIHAIIAARLDTLPLDRKALLQDASVIGKAFSAQALSHMTGLGEGFVADGLHELARRELVRSLGTTSVEYEPEFAFWHVLIRDVAYGQIPRAARARKHRLVAEWIQSVSGERLGDVAEVVAYHYRQALELVRASGTADDQTVEEPARRFLMMAGERALSLDVRRAAEHFRNALALLPPDHPERGPLMVKTAEAEAWAGMFAEAEHRYEEAIAALGATGDPVRAGDAMVKLSNLLWHRGETGRSRALLEEAIRMLEAQAPGPELVRAYVDAGGDKLDQLLQKEAIQLAEKALSLAGEVGAEDQVPTALAIRGFAKCDLGDLEGLDDVRRALDLAVNLGLGRETARLHEALASLLRATEGPQAALDVAREGIALAERLGNLDMAMAIKATNLERLFDTGRWDELLDEAEQITRWSPPGESYFSVLARSYRARVLLARGQLEEAQRLVDALLPQAREIRDLQILAPALLVGALVESERGEPSRAVGLVREFVQLAGDRPAGVWYAFCLPDLLGVCLQAGETALAERLVTEVPAPTTLQRLSLLTAQGILKEAEGDLEVAARTYDEAATGWARFGMPVEEARTLLGAGRCRVRLGLPEGADRLQAARAIFGRLGARLFVDRCDSLLREAAAEIR